MIFYKFYLHDSVKGDILLGVLPERRKNPKRITHESIINWGRKYFGTNANDESIFFIRTVLEETEKQNPTLSTSRGVREKILKTKNSLFGFN